MTGVEILQELKQDDYELYCHTGHSHFEEKDWDWLIEQFKIKQQEVEKEVKL